MAGLAHLVTRDRRVAAPEDRCAPIAEHPGVLTAQRQGERDRATGVAIQVETHAFPAAGGRHRALHQPCLVGVDHERHRTVLDGAVADLEPRAVGHREVERDYFRRTRHDRFAIDLTQPLPARTGRDRPEVLFDRGDADRFDLEVGIGGIGRFDQQPPCARHRKAARYVGQDVGIELVTGGELRLERRGVTTEVRQHVVLAVFREDGRHIVGPVGSHPEGCAGRDLEADLDGVDKGVVAQRLRELGHHHRLVAGCSRKHAFANLEVVDAVEHGPPIGIETEVDRWTFFVVVGRLPVGVFVLLVGWRGRRDRALPVKPPLGSLGRVHLDRAGHRHFSEEVDEVDGDRIQRRVACRRPERPARDDEGDCRPGDERVTGRERDLSPRASIGHRESSLSWS